MLVYKKTFVCQAKKIINLYSVICNPDSGVYPQERLTLNQVINP